MLPSERQAPQNLDAEAAVLGCILLCPGPMLGWVADHDESVFYSRPYQLIYAALKGCIQRGEQVDALVLREALSTQGVLEQVGGAGIIMALFDSVPTAANWEYYTGLVESTDVRRRMLNAAGIWLRSVRDGNGHADPAELVPALVQALQRMSTRFAREAAGTAETQSLSEIMLTVYGDIEAAAQAGAPVAQALPTGLTDLDRQLGGGLMPRGLYVLAGRPGMGKTSCAETIICHMLESERQPRILWFPIESGGQESAYNLLSQTSGQSVQTLRSGVLSNDGWAGVADAFGRLNVGHVRINETPRLTPERLLAEAKLTQQADGLDLIVVDYLQRLRTDGRNIEERTSMASIELAETAKECHVPVLAVAQMNRESEARTGHRPRLSDLRGSGQIEQDAKAVMLLYRPDYYQDDDRPGEADLILAKNRDGATGIVPLTWRPEIKRYESAARQQGELPEPVPDPRVPE